MTADLKLLTAFSSDALTTPNRVAMAPMTRNRAGESRVPNAMMATYYAQRATAGLLVSEAVDVSKRAIGYPGTPGIYTPEMVKGWSDLVSTVRNAQPEPAPFFCQLFHTGRVSHRSLRDDATPGVGPSAIAAGIQLYTPAGMQDADVPEALSADGIRQTIADYVAAAKSAVQAGFDGIEINAGNGYLVHQFLSDGTNQRTDDYGGSIPNRLRFALELVDAVSDAIGAMRVALRVSPTNPTNNVSESNPEAVYTALAKAVDGKGLAYLHIIETASERHITPKMRALYSGTVIVNQGYDRDSGEAAVQDGVADLVSYGTKFLANPDLPARFAKGAELNEADPNTFYGGDETGYTDYPAMG